MLEKYTLRKRLKAWLTRISLFASSHEVSSRASFEQNAENWDQAQAQLRACREWLLEELLLVMELYENAAMTRCESEFRKSGNKTAALQTYSRQLCQLVKSERDWRTALARKAAAKQPQLITNAVRINTLARRLQPELESDVWEARFEEWAND